MLAHVTMGACVLDELETATKPDQCIASGGFFLMALASLGLTDLPLVTTMMLGMVRLLVGVVADEYARVVRLEYRCGDHVARVTGAEPAHRLWRQISASLPAMLAHVSP